MRNLKSGEIKLLSREQLKGIIGGTVAEMEVCAYLCGNTYKTIQCSGGCTYSSGGNEVTCGNGSRAGCADEEYPWEEIN